MSTTKIKKPKAKDGALVCKEASVTYQIKKPKVIKDTRKDIVKAGSTKKQRPVSDEPWVTPERIGAYIESRCKTRKSTLAYFKEIGLTYNEKGEPVVVPR